MIVRYEEPRNRNRYGDFTPTLLRLIYAFGKEINRQKLANRLIKNSMFMDNADCKVDKSNIFAVIIERYIREHIDDKNLGSGQRSRYSRALAYAYDHKITTNWLGAFLKEVGGYEAAALKYDRQEREGWIKRRATFG